MAEAHGQATALATGPELTDLHLLCASRGAARGKSPALTLRGTVARLADGFSCARAALDHETARRGQATCRQHVLGLFLPIVSLLHCLSLSHARESPVGAHLQWTNMRPYARRREGGG